MKLGGLGPWLVRTSGRGLRPVRRKSSYWLGWRDLERVFGRPSRSPRGRAVRGPNVVVEMISRGCVGSGRGSDRYVATVPVRAK